MITIGVNLPVIEEANWLTLCDDLEDLQGRPAEGYDAVLCLGNSFPHLPDLSGQQTEHKVNAPP